MAVKKKSSPRFITFEGGEGSGKSTQVAMLAVEFQDADIPHIVTREPGGTPDVEQIRALLVQGDPDRWDPLCETLLFQAARIQHVNRVIKPALAQGKWVLCDRFVDSTLVYQGIAKGISTKTIQALQTLTLGSFAPDLTFLLDLPPDKGLARTHARTAKEDRFEQMDLHFHTRLRQGFRKLAKQNPKRILIINASLETQAVHQRLVAALKDRYNVPL